MVTICLIAIATTKANSLNHESACLVDVSSIEKTINISLLILFDLVGPTPITTAGKTLV